MQNNINEKYVDAESYNQVSNQLSGLLERFKQSESVIKELNQRIGA